MQICLYHKHTNTPDKAYTPFDFYFHLFDYLDKEKTKFEFI